MSYVNNGKIKIHFRVEGQGLPLVMLHSGFGSLEDFYEFGYVDSLRDSHQLILVDIRPHGQSDKPTDPDQYKFKKYADDVILVLDRLDIKQAHVYGHSMGGYVAFSLAKYYPERILSMINSDGVPSSHDPEVIKKFIELSEEEIREMGIFTEGFLERYLLNDKSAFYAVAEWMSKEIGEVMEEISNTIDVTKMPCLFIQSNEIKEGTEEFDLIQKGVKTIDGAKEIIFDELNHLTVYSNSEVITPVIRKFLRT